MSSDLQNLPPLHVFDTEGMNTIFSIRIHHADREAALRLAGNCFRLLEDLEAELSRYRPDSEVSRINAMKAGDSMLLADATYRCLQRAVEAAAATAGLFDPTLGAQTRKREDHEEAPPPAGKLTLSPDRPQIVCEEAGRQVDLGGIGKGFALDEMAITLKDLGVDAALLSCGASTHLAVGARPCKIRLASGREADDDSGTPTIRLAESALSASGLGEQGAHVVHPDTGESPDYDFARVWVIANSAALADAFSTACLIMDEKEIRSFAAARREDGVVIHVEDAVEGRTRRIEPPG